jgi:hypothetical protein
MLRITQNAHRQHAATCGTTVSRTALPAAAEGLGRHRTSGFATGSGIGQILTLFSGAVGLLALLLLRIASLILRVISGCRQVVVIGSEYCPRPRRPGIELERGDLAGQVLI